VSTSRRLRGVAAISAVILAVAGLAVSISATDECTDAECLFTEDGGLDFLRPILEAQGCDILTEEGGLDFLMPMLEAQGLPRESVDQLRAMYEQMAQICGDDGAGKVSDPGNDGGPGPAGPQRDQGEKGPARPERPEGPQGPEGPPQGPQGPAGELPASTDSTGGGQAHANTQPFVTLNCIIALQGIYPGRNGGSSADSFIGEVKWFAGTFAPSGWAFCDGQLLPIAQNPALFSILGTQYGGDGRTTFALPDARGRAILHAGNGPGLTPRSVGEKNGQEGVTLTVVQMPTHDHAIAE
jgi:microcystin-dependent protein